ncbi:TPR end-of-group domain-containing protein [Marinimicrobium alkaliphilum]|uniref:TPR end-of-group domain-containing protein n=1 Tax=Marinimicrobium alkaliphilum TaxID=2202654 RepID=UPI000DB9C80B|nr:CDC27 family protein [Marinimicrobium alkaliphilum]
MRCLIALVALFVAAHGWAAESEPDEFEENRRVAQAVDELGEPLYSPFIERYVLDELKQLRVDMANVRVELIQQVVDREIDSIDRGVTYATNTITYFFYLIAGVSSILVVVGWTSIRDIKEKMGNLADEEVGKLVDVYEARLRSIEKQLTQKTRHIDANREEIERTQEMHALWLRAGLENSAANKIAIYDQILATKPNDTEALTYKADAVLELGEPQWAINLCHQALSIDKGNAHAFYQLACAHTVLEHYDEAIQYLAEALRFSESYLDEILQEPALQPLAELPAFQELVGERGHDAST